MDIAALNEKITIQKNTVVIDEIGNHTNAWTDYHECFSTISGEESTVGAESQIAGQTLDTSKINFTIRYCQAVDEINSVEYRVVFNDEIFNILNIDHLNYKKKAIKLMCKKERR